MGLELNNMEMMNQAINKYGITSVIDNKYATYSTKMEIPSTGHVYVFDLDGTIADIDHRLHYVNEHPKDWEGFFSEVKDDSPKDWIIDIMRMLPMERILIFSGRSNSTAKDTIAWLDKYDVPYAEMRMRWHHNFESDELLKPRMAEDYWDRIRFIADDRQRVVDMWRENGFNVLQVDKWEERPLKNPKIIKVKGEV